MREMRERGGAFNAQMSRCQEGEEGERSEFAEFLAAMDTVWGGILLTIVTTLARL